MHFEESHDKSRAQARHMSRLPFVGDWQQLYVRSHKMAAIKSFMKISKRGTRLAINLPITRLEVECM